MAIPTRSPHYHKWYATFTRDGAPLNVIVLIPPMSEIAAGTLTLRWAEALGVRDQEGDSATLKSALRFAKQPKR